MNHSATPRVGPREAMTALSEFAGSKRHELTELETRMWLSFVERVDCEKFLRFLVNWGLRSPFVPTPADAAKALGVVATPEQSFELAMREVAQTGPYRSPEFNDPALRRAIVLMGGWVRFCEEAPDPANDYAHAQFRKRFIELYAQANNEVEVQGVPSPPLLGLAETRTNQLLAMSRTHLLSGAGGEPSAGEGASPRTAA